MSEDRAAAELFSGDGAIAKRARAFDWAATPIGPVAGWPEILKNTVRLILATRHPAMIGWGADLVAIPNDAYLALLRDARHDHILGNPVSETFADFWPYLEAKIAPVLSGEGASWTESEPVGVTYQDGTRGKRYWTYSHSPIPDGTAQRGIGGFLLLGQDVTETVIGAQGQQAAIAAMSESEERFRRIADSAPVPIWVTQVDRTRGFANQAYLDFIGLPYDEALSFDWRQIIHPQDVDRIVAELVAGEASMNVFALEGRYRNGAGEWRWLRSESQPRFGPNGEHLGFIGVAHDISSAKEAERVIRASEEKYRGLFESIGVGFCILEVEFDDDRPVDYRFTEINPAFTAQSGLPQDAVGKSVREIVPDLEQFWFDTYGRVAWTGEAARFEHEAAPMGRWFEVHAYRTGAPEERRVAILFNDITERRRIDRQLRDLNETLEVRVAAETAERVRAEESLRQAQKLESLGQLTGGIAHDFNNYLTVILQSAELMQREGLSDERRQRYVEAIGETARRAADLTAQLLAFARRAPLSTEPFDAGEKLKAMKPVLETLLGERIRLTMDCRPGCFVDTDAGQLQSAIVNLTANARDAMPEGGALDIACSCTDDRIVIIVADTGQGISADKLAAVFEPFFTTKAVGKGTGLGLSQVYGFAQASCGEVRVESEEGQGARFILTLPCAERPVSKLAFAAPAPKARRALYVLLVEDNAPVAEVTRAMLEDLGHRVDACSEATSALAQVDRQPYDLILSDVVMPGEIDGLGLAEALRLRGKATPIILATGYSQRLSEAPGHGFEILRKPYTPEQLTAAIAKLVK